MVEVTHDDLHELEGITPELREEAEHVLQIAQKRFNRVRSKTTILKMSNAGEVLIRLAFKQERDNARVISAVQNMMIRRLQELNIDQREEEQTD